MDKFNIEHQYNLYVDRVYIDKGKMPEAQKRETKSAFMGACGMILVLFRYELSELPEKKAIKVLDNMFSQVANYFLEESNRTQ